MPHEEATGRTTSPKGGPQKDTPASPPNSSHPTTPRREPPPDSHPPRPPPKATTPGGTARGPQKGTVAQPRRDFPASGQGPEAGKSPPLAPVQETGRKELYCIYIHIHHQPTIKLGAIPKEIFLLHTQYWYLVTGRESDLAKRPTSTRTTVQNVPPVHTLYPNRNKGRFTFSRKS